MLKAKTSIFKDKATSVLRVLLAEPHKKWSVREISSTSKTSVGLVSKTVGILKELGIAECGGLGTGGYTMLKDQDELLRLWRNSYDFSLNRVSSFYSQEQAGTKKVLSYLKKNGILHAVTLHFGANLLTNYFMHDHCYIYVADKDIDDLATDMSAILPLQRLANGGNLHFVSPYYRNSFRDKMRAIKGISVVSNLQLYLDLYHFMPRGQEHAEYLKKLSGGSFYE